MVSRRSEIRGCPMMHMQLAATALAAQATARLAEHALFGTAQRLVPLTEPTQPRR